MTMQKRRLDRRNVAYSLIGGVWQLMSTLVCVSKSTFKRALNFVRAAFDGFSFEPTIVSSTRTACRRSQLSCLSEHCSRDMSYQRAFLGDQSLLLERSFCLCLARQLRPLRGKLQPAIFQRAHRCPSHLVAHLGLRAVVLCQKG